MTEVPIMVMPWHRPDPCKPPKMQNKAAFKASYLDYLGSLDVESPPLAVPLTGIMCTIGSASNDVDVLMELMSSGMTMALVPLAIGQRQDHIDMIAKIRTANTAYNQTQNMVLPLAIAVQMKGPGLRIGGIYKDVPVQLNMGQKITLTTDNSWRLRGTENFIYVNFPEMAHVLTKGDVLLLGNGVVILQVESIEETEVVCQVVGGGLVHSFMTLCVPDVPLHLPPLSDQDVDDLRLVASLGVDIVVATHTQTGEHIKDIRNILSAEDNGSGIKVWAQIETKEAVDNLDCILGEADAVLLSRVSLAQDISTEKLFLVQKKVISHCNKVGVPVYLSSHYLPSMRVELTPPITEVFDVANAILDGADGFVLRNTTSIGKHPELVVKALVPLCREAEAAVWQHQTFSFLTNHLPPPIDPTFAVAISAVEASLKASAAAILLATTSGRSAKVLARFRPRCPVIAITRYGQVARQLNTWRAVIPLHYVDPPLSDWTREVDLRMQFGIEYAKEHGIIVPGDVLVLMNGWRQGAGFTNTLRLVYASDSFPWVYPHKLPDQIPPDRRVMVDSESLPSGRTTGSIHSQRTAEGDKRPSQHTQRNSTQSTLKDKVIFQGSQNKLTEGTKRPSQEPQTQSLLSKKSNQATEGSQKNFTEGAKRPSQEPQRQSLLSRKSNQASKIGEIILSNNQNILDSISDISSQQNTLDKPVETVTNSMAEYLGTMGKVESVEKSSVKDSKHTVQSQISQNISQSNKSNEDTKSIIPG